MTQTRSAHVLGEAPAPRGGISRQLEHYIFWRLAPGGIRYLTRPDYERASGLAAQVLAQAEHEFQAVPPVTLHFASPTLMAAVAGAIREVFAAGAVDRRRRELVATVTSKINTCPYCVDVHTMMLQSAGAHDVARSVDHGSDTGIDAWDSLARWARATLQPTHPILRAPPMSSEERPQLYGTAVLFQYINRMVNVFLEPSPFPLPTGFKWLKGWAAGLAEWLFGRRVVSMRIAPGGALYSLESADLPDEFVWAWPDAFVARAFATLAKEAEEAGRAALAPEVRAFVRQRVGQWNGETMPMDGAWIAAEVSALDAEHRPAARLSLLTALASYRVDAKVVAAFRELEADDARLLGAVSWSSYVAAQRVASWIAGP
jgi:AhpD family alkylhydroperoxidase